MPTKPRGRATFERLSTQVPPFAMDDIRMLCERYEVPLAEMTRRLLIMGLADALDEIWPKPMIPSEVVWTSQADFSEQAAWLYACEKAHNAKTEKSGTSL